MNNKSMSGSLSIAPSTYELHLDFVNLEKLGAYWNYTALPGIHWRLYRNFQIGAGLVLSDGAKMAMSPDNLYLIPPFHSVGTWCTGEPEQLFMHFHLEGCKFPRQSVFVVPCLPHLHTLCEQCVELLRERKYGYKSNYYALSLIYATLAELLDDSLQSQEINSKIMIACESMKNDIARPWSNDELACRIGYSKNAFIRKFREVIGITPYQYLQNLRYARATELLESTDLTIEEICSRIGINDRYHFSREFKRIHERSPVVFRKMRQNILEPY